MSTRRSRRTRRRAVARVNPPVTRRGAPIIELDAAEEPADAVQAGMDAIPRGAAAHPGGADADADPTGEEGVGGTVATPDKDVVDDIGRACGVEQPDEEAFTPSSEILTRRDRFRWHLERDAEDEAEGRPHRRRGAV